MPGPSAMVRHSVPSGQASLPVPQGISQLQNPPPSPQPPSPQYFVAVRPLGQAPWSLHRVPSSLIEGRSPPPPALPPEPAEASPRSPADPAAPEVPLPAEPAVPLPEAPAVPLPEAPPLPALPAVLPPLPAELPPLPAEPPLADPPPSPSSLPPHATATSNPDSTDPITKRRVMPTLLSDCKGSSRRSLSTTCGLEA